MLFNHAGNGIEATFNKNAPGDDAAFAFKTGFSARALIGLLGNDDFIFKVMPAGKCNGPEASPFGRFRIRSMDAW